MSAPIEKKNKKKSKPKLQSKATVEKQSLQDTADIPQPVKPEELNADVIKLTSEGSEELKVIEEKEALKLGKRISKKIKSIPKHKKEQETVIYVGRLPLGFYEDQLRSYFSQFGEITHLRLARNKKSGNSKHYAFLGFKYREVAQVVVETMQGYLLLGHQLQCKILNEDQVHPDLWKGADQPFKVLPHKVIQRQQFNQKPSKEQHEKRMNRLARRQEKKKQQMAQLGIEI